MRASLPSGPASQNRLAEPEAEHQSSLSYRTRDCKRRGRALSKHLKITHELLNPLSWSTPSGLLWLQVLVVPNQGSSRSVSVKLAFKGSFSHISAGVFKHKSRKQVLSKESQILSPLGKKVAGVIYKDKILCQRPVVPPLVKMLVWTVRPDFLCIAKTHPLLGRFLRPSVCEFQLTPS